MSTIRSANYTTVIWAEPALKKKNVKTAVTGVTAEMPRQKRKAEITKTSHEFVPPPAPSLVRAGWVNRIIQKEA
jgi:hypothetical protein